MGDTKPGQGNPNPKDSNKFREDMKAAEIAARDLAKDMGYVLENLRESTKQLDKQAGSYKNLTKSSQMLNYLGSKNVQVAKDLAALYDNEVAANNTLVLKQNMRSTGLKGDYAQLLTTYMLENNITDVNDEKVQLLIKQLTHRQHENELIAKQTELIEAEAAWLEEMHEELDGYTMGWEKLKSKIKTLATDPKVAKAFFAAEGIKTAKEGLEGMEKRFDALKQSGLSAGQAAQGMVKSTSAMSILGLSDTQGVMQGMVEQYGNVNALSGDMVDDLGQMAVHMGITGQEAMKLNASLSQMPGETAESAKNAMEHVGHMAEMEGIAPGKIAKDMAGGTAEMARAGAKGAEAFGKSVINLHKMGVELGTASKIADGLLDFESRINNQMEASVLLGREINLDKAAELALNNKLEEATAEVVKNIGGAAEFSKMNRLEQNALAKATGMTVEEMTKYIDAQEEQEKYHGKAAGFWMNTFGYSMEYGSKVGGFLKEHGLLLLSAMTYMKQFGGPMTMIKDGWKSVTGGIKGAWDAAKGMFQTITGGKDKVKDLAAQVSEMKKKDPTLTSKEALAKIKGKGADVAGGAADQTKKLSEASSKAPSPQAGMGVRLFLKNLAAGLKSFGKNAGQILKGVGVLAIAGVMMGIGLGAIGMAIKAMGGSATEMIAIGVALVLFAGSFWLMTKALGKVDIGSVMKGALALVVMGAALIPAAFAFSLLADVPIENMIAFALMLPLLAIGVMALGAALAGPQAILFMLGIAALAMLGGVLILLGAGLLVAGIGMEKFAESAVKVIANLGPIAGAISEMASMVGPLSEIAAALLGIGAGLTFMAVAGFTAMPIIGMLIGLAAVAPALTGLAKALTGGGGEAEKNDKMDELIAEVRSLKTEMASITVNLDGKKVGDALRGSMNTSRVR